LTLTSPGFYSGLVRFPLVSVIVVCGFTAGVLAQQRGAAPAQPAPSGTPQELAALGRKTLEELRRSTKPAEHIAGCDTPAAPEPSCAPAMMAIAGDTRVEMPLRFRAAAAAGTQRQQLFRDLAKQASTGDLKQSVDAIGQAPAEVAVPAFKRLLESSNETERVAGARGLATFPTPESIEALRAAGAAASPGTALWAAVTAARARLGQTDALATVGAAHQYLRGADLLLAAEALRAVGDQRGDALAGVLARTGTGVEQLQGAAIVREQMATIFREVLASALRGTDPAVTAEALRIARTTAQPQPADPIPFLSSTDPIVRARAAELVIERAAHKNQSGVPR
jgi:hypothetical protein